MRTSGTRQNHGEESYAQQSVKEQSSKTPGGRCPFGSHEACVDSIIRGMPLPQESWTIPSLYNVHSVARIRSGICIIELLPERRADRLLETVASNI